MKGPQKESVCSSVVSVCLFFLLVAALNDLDVRTCDIQNVCVNTEASKEKVWFQAGDELGSDKGKVIIVKRALCGLRSSGSCFRSHVAQTFSGARFKSCKADPDIWMTRKAVKPDGTKFHEHCLCCVDDICYQGLKCDEFMKFLEVTAIGG